MVLAIVLIILIILSAFFSASETALTSANKIRLKHKAENGSRQAKIVLKILEKYDKALTTILIGNNIVNIATSSIATIVAIGFFGDQNGPIIATVIVTVVVLIFGEIMPKTVAKNFADGFSMAIGGIMNFLMFILTPFSALFILLQKGVMKLFRNRKQDVTVTEQELIHIIDEIEDEGVLEKQEGMLVRSALEFDETTAEEILTPRVNIVAVELNEDISKVRDIFFNEGYSRMPVYEKTIDHIVGLVNQKQFFQNIYNNNNFHLRDVVKETIFIPNLMRISEVLRLMQRQKVHMAVVVDQYGGTQGILTLEDILEELVGEIYDEGDEITAPIKFVSENEFELNGSLQKNDFNRFFEKRDMDFEILSDSNTIGGWVLELFGKIPEPMDVVQTDKFQITVETCSGRKIEKIRFKILQPEIKEE